MKKFFKKIFHKKKKTNRATMDNLSKILSPDRPILSGLLSKYTNVMKGYQTRFCRVDAENGILSYYLNETDEQLVPRGKVQLIGALVNPSFEDSRTFIINSASGDQIKFKAYDAKSRQTWIDGLRVVVENISAQSRSTNKEHLAAYDCFIATRKQLTETEQANSELSRTIENHTDHNDPDLLLLKALSSATTSTLSQAFVYLQRYNETSRQELY